jgi:hypothetical protein
LGKLEEASRWDSLGPIQMSRQNSIAAT